MKTMRPGALGLALLCALLGLAAPAQAQSVSCSQASMPDLIFGNVDLVNGTGMSATTNLTYKCTASGNSGKTVNVCFNIGDPYGNFADRRLKNGANELKFQMYQDGAATTVWGTVWGGASLPPVVISIPGNNTQSGTIALTASIGAGQTTPPPGTYLADYTGNGTLINYAVGSCTAGSPSVNSNAAFPFKVSATVVKACKASAVSTIDLGNALASATNIDANGDISITCSNTTPYYVGLQPSNGNTAGAGIMSASGGNTDKVPYQLYSSPAPGTIWGNTATAAGAGNGIAGMGNGTAKSHTVYVRAPSADYRPDSYSDTVTVVVNY